MIGPEEVAVGVMARWTSQHATRVAYPGGLWYGKVNEQAAAPYARLTVTAEEPKRISDGRYHRGFAVRVSVWGDTGPGPIGNVSLTRKAVESVMTGLTVSGAIKVVDVKTVGGELEVDETPRAANDVCLMGLEWRVLIEGN